MDQFNRSNTLPGGALGDRITRLRRALATSGRFGRALREDHELFWQVAADQVPGLSAVQRAKVAGFTQRVDRLLAQVVAGEGALDRLGGLAPDQAMVLLSRHDPTLLAQAAQGLDTTGRQLRQELEPAYMQVALTRPPAPLPPRASQTQPIGEAAPATTPTKADTGKIGYWLQKLVAKPQVQTEAPPPPPSSAERRGTELRRTFEAAVATVERVLDCVKTELTLVHVALGAVNLPGPGRPWAQVPPALQAGAADTDLSPTEQSWLAPLAKRLVQDMEAVKRSHMAVTQWIQARKLCGEAQHRVTLLQRYPPDQHAQILAEADVGPLRGSVLPLTHLHLQFAGIPVFCQLFPPP